MPRLKLTLSRISSPSFQQALHQLGNERLPVKLSYRIGRVIRDVKSHAQDFQRAKIESIKANGAVLVCLFGCKCGEPLRGEQGQAVVCTKCDEKTDVPKDGEMMWHLPEGRDDAKAKYQAEVADAGKQEIEVFLDNKIKLSELDGAKISPLVIEELMDILEEPA